MAVTINGDGTIIGSNVNWVNLGTDSIVEGDIATDAVTSTELKDNAVITAKIADDAVTGGKLNISLLKGDIVHASAADTLARLPKGLEGQILTMGASGVPTWTTPAVVSANQWSWVETHATTGSEVGNYIYMLQNNVQLGYDYLLTWRDIRQGGNLELKMNIMTGATPAALTSSYLGTTHFAYNTTHTAIREITSYINLSHVNDFTGADPGDAHFGEFTFIDPARAYEKAMYGTSGQYNVNQGEVWTSHHHCWSTNVIPMTGIRIGDGSNAFRAPEVYNGGTNSPKFIIYKRKIS
mgnify:CR=1 FL=1